MLWSENGFWFLLPFFRKTFSQYLIRNHCWNNKHLYVVLCMYIFFCCCSHRQYHVVFEIQISPFWVLLVASEGRLTELCREHFINNYLMHERERERDTKRWQKSVSSPSLVAFTLKNDSCIMSFNIRCLPKFFIYNFLIYVYMKCLCVCVCVFSFNLAYERATISIQFTNIRKGLHRISLFTESLRSGHCRTSQFSSRFVCEH